MSQVWCYKSGHQGDIWEGDCEVKRMKSKIDYYILIPKGEWERFSKSLNKAAIAISKSIGELGNTFGRVAKVLKDDKFYKAICKANKYIEEKERLKERNNAKSD